jgi:GDP-L-fucose synthase
VVAALIRCFHEAKVSGAKSVVVWGTGTPRREFLYVDDMADACVHLMKTYSGAELINIGTGEDITIAEFARVVAEVVGYSGEISFDTRVPTARRASCSTSAASPSSAGARRPRFTRA